MYVHIVGNEQAMPRSRRETCETKNANFVRSFSVSGSQYAFHGPPLKSVSCDVLCPQSLSSMYAVSIMHRRISSVAGVYEVDATRSMLLKKLK